MTVSLIEAIARWDEKSKSQIEKVYEQFHQEEQFFSTLATLLEAPEFQVGATWLIKHDLEQRGRELTPSIQKRLFKACSQLEHWGSKLHLLQCMPRLRVPKSCVPQVESFLRGCMAEENKFVRAWAYTGFHQLALQYPVYQAEVEEMLAAGLASETAGSIKSRIRQAIKQGFPAE